MRFFSSVRPRFWTWLIWANVCSCGRKFSDRNKQQDPLEIWLGNFVMSGKPMKFWQFEWLSWGWFWVYNLFASQNQKKRSHIWFIMNYSQIHYIRGFLRGFLWLCGQKYGTIHLTSPLQPCGCDFSGLRFLELARTTGASNASRRKRRR